MNVTMIGMPGSGKTTLGRKLAGSLGCAFIDTDDLLAAVSGTGLQDIIDENGEARLLKLEEKVILSLELSGQTVIATGGSVVYSPGAMRFLRDRSVIVFLDLSLSMLETRLSDLPTRAVVGIKGNGLPGLYRQRLALYRAYADITVTVTPGDSDQDVIAAILRLLAFRPGHPASDEFTRLKD